MKTITTSVTDHYYSCVWCSKLKIEYDILSNCKKYKYKLSKFIWNIYNNQQQVLSLVILTATNESTFIVII